MEESDCCSQQFGNCLWCALPTSVHLMRVYENEGISFNKNVHFDLCKQKRHFPQNLKLALGVFLLLFGILSLTIAQFYCLLDLQNHITVIWKHFFIELFVFQVCQPLVLELFQAEHRSFNFGLLFDNLFLLDRVSFVAEVNLPSSFAEIHVADPLLSQILSFIWITSIKLERAASPPFLSSTISVIDNSLPLLILKLQNLMVC